MQNIVQILQIADLNLRKNLLTKTKKKKKIKTNFFLAITHDVILKKNTLKYLISCAEKNPEFGIIGPNYTNIKINYGSSYPYLETILGSAMFFDTKRFFRIGGFDKNFFMYYEDNDICQRAKINKYQLIFCKKSMVEHSEKSKKSIPHAIYKEINEKIL